MEKLAFRAMGSGMLAVLDDPSPRGEKALRDVPAWFEEWEQCLSRFRPESELSRLNRSAGKEILISQMLWEVLQVSREMERVTSGLVSPAILGALETAGYDRSFDTILAGDSAGYASFAAQPGFDLIRKQGSTLHSFQMPLETRLDLGGIAKGWAASKAVERLQEFGPALVDAGGDIAISGPRADGSPWPIGIEDPFQPDRSLETLMLREGAVATSGTDYHRWKQGKIWNHHIIDPRTGLPAATDLLTVTVVAPDAIMAEAAAKTVLILGSYEGLDWLEDQPGVEGLLVLQFGGRLQSENMKEYLWKEN
jgi:FAD:protein FMN transferase